MDNMVWNVYKENLNTREIEIYNIFNHAGFARDIENLLTANLPTVEFIKELESILMYHFWARAEYEVVITSWPPHIEKTELDRLNSKWEECEKAYNMVKISNTVNLSTGIKVDIYSQVMLNFDRFVDYILNSNKAELHK